MSSADGPAIALVTFADFPSGWDDDKLLAASLTRLGAKVTFACWDDPAVQWPALDAAVIRSTWDYHRRLDAFLAWCDFVAAATTLHNPAPLVRWNSHKGYLLELAAAGVPVVPTELVPAGGAHRLGAGEWVVKPAVSIGADRTVRGATQTDVDALVATSDALVQPYLREVEAGEISIVCIAGTPTHAVRKVPAAGDFRTQEHHGAAIARTEVTADLERIARAALAVLDAPPAYARVDVVLTAAGPVLMELELIEPTLWFEHDRTAADALAAHVLDGLR